MEIFGCCTKYSNLVSFMPDAVDAVSLHIYANTMLFNVSCELSEELAVFMEKI